MIDRNLLVDAFEPTKAKLMRKGVAADAIDQARDLLLERRKAVAAFDDLKARLNSESAQIGQLIRKGQVDQAESLKAEVAGLKQQMQEREEDLKRVDQSCDIAFRTLPNIPDDQAPDGHGDQDNKVLRWEGYSEESYSHCETPPHWDIADSLGILDTKRAAKISGSMFAILRGDGARLLRALLQFATDLNRDRYEEMICPHLVRSETLMGTCHLPKFSEDIFKMAQDDLWAIPTGEVPLTAFHQNEILNGDELPLRYMTYTACFRREAGSAGKETRGLQRLHEFHKLELVHIVAPEQGESAFQDLLADAEKPLKLLGLPYRILDLCTGDLTFSSSRMHDIEVYAPGSKSWLECSSVGLFTDFQARSGRIRFRRTPKSKPEIVYTLNGSGLATPRVFAALLEHGYQKDGSVRLPEAIRPYMAGQEEMRPRRS